MQEYRVTVGEFISNEIRFYKPGTSVLHRLDGPAIEFADGSKYWCQNDQLHRLDGPAIEWNDGGKSWYQHGKCHRTDGPAVEMADGDKSWYQEGKCHRIDGPAVERADGTVGYWIDGKRLTEEQFKQKTTSVKEMTIAEIEKVLGHSVKIIK